MTDEIRKKIAQAHLGQKHTEEWKNKHSQAISGEKNPMFGKHLSEEAKRKLSESRKGKYCGENNPMYGKHLSEATKEKLRKAQTGNTTRKGKHHSEETKKKIAEKAKQRLSNPENNPMYGKRGKDNPNYGKKRTEEQRRRLSLG